MSRYVTGGTSNYLANATAVVTDYPFTVSYWVRLASHTGTQCHFYVGSAVSNVDYFGMGSDTSGKPLLLARNSSANQILTHTAAMSDGVWYNVTGVFESATDRRVYLSADSGSQDTVSVTKGTGFDVTALGRLSRGGPTFAADARLAHMAVWNTGLSSNDRTLLAQGAIPQYVSAASLLSYWPLKGSASPEPDAYGSLSLTINGTVADGADDGPVGLKSARRSVARQAVTRAATR